MAQRDVWINLYAEGASGALSAPAPWNNLVIASDSAESVQFPSLPDTNGEATSLTLSSSPGMLANNQGNITSGSIHNGIPAEVFKGGWGLMPSTGPEERAIHLSGLIPDSLVVAQLFRPAISQAAGNVHFGENTVSLPKKNNIAVEAPYEVSGTVDSAGNLEILLSVPSNDIAPFVLAGMRLSFRDGVGDVDYPVVSAPLVIDEFGTRFTGGEVLKAWFFDPVTQAFIDSVNAFIGTGGLVQAGSSKLQFNTDYRVIFETPTRNWTGILRTGI